jgi:hypothetical protein
LGHIQPEGAGRIEEFGGRKPQTGMPDRGIDDKNELGAIYIRKPRVRGE